MINCLKLLSINHKKNIFVKRYKSTVTKSIENENIKGFKCLSESHGKLIVISS